MHRDIQQDKQFYGPYYGRMILIKEQTILALEDMGNGIVQHIQSRVKSATSMVAKLEKRQLPVDAQTAVTQIHDAIGIRIICNFLDDVQSVATEIRNSDCWTVLQEKDYITNPKPNGYRSLHLVVAVQADGWQLPVEIQIRTISQDAWASLEHQMKYKKDVPHQRLIQAELKRCADELASTDVSMQTIRDLLDGTADFFS